MVEMMKDEGEDGDDGIWINEEDQNASETLIDNYCICVKV
jgi:hypothetical protein